MKTLTEIESEARRLCGTEFKAEIHAKSVWVVHRDEFTDDDHRAVDPDHCEAIFDVSGNRYMYVNLHQPVNYDRAARFIAICSQLDQFIKGE